MGSKQRSKLQVQKDQEAVARFYAQGLTIRQIHERVKKEVYGGKAGAPCLTTVFKDLQAVKQLWLDSLKDTVEVRQAEELANLQQLYREAWEAWRDSRKFGAGLGEPRYLAEIRQVIQMRCKMLGLDAPTKIQVNDTPTQIVIDWVAPDVPEGE